MNEEQTLLSKLIQLVYITGIQLKTVRLVHLKMSLGFSDCWTFINIITLLTITKVYLYFVITDLSQSRSIVVVIVVSTTISYLTNSKTLL